MSDVIDLQLKRRPAHYTVHITHNWDGSLEFLIQDVADDPRSRRAVLEAMQRISGLQESADAMHEYLLSVADGLMSATDGKELDRLEQIAELIEAYEGKRFNV